MPLGGGEQCCKNLLFLFDHSLFPLHGPHCLALGLQDPSPSLELPQPASGWLHRASQQAWEPVSPSYAVVSPKWMKNLPDPLVLPCRSLSEKQNQMWTRRGKARLPLSVLVTLLFFLLLSLSPSLPLDAQKLLLFKSRKSVVRSWWCCFLVFGFWFFSNEDRKFLLFWKHYLFPKKWQANQLQNGFSCIFSGVVHNTKKRKKEKSSPMSEIVSAYKGRCYNGLLLVLAFSC